VKADLWGGPHDGQQINVPDHLRTLRVPMPVQFQPTIFGEGQIEPVFFPVALYERTKVVRHGSYVYRYRGQERT
jgi:hypothetical protein